VSAPVIVSVIIAGHQVGHLEVADEGQLAAHRGREQDRQDNPDTIAERVTGEQRDQCDRHGQDR
jgi:hypothetical protein